MEEYYRLSNARVKVRYEQLHWTCSTLYVDLDKTLCCMLSVWPGCYGLEACDSLDLRCGLKMSLDGLLWLRYFCPGLHA